MIVNDDLVSKLTALRRTIKAKVELYNGSTLADTFAHDGALKEITLDRVGENAKFFGFGICQKAKVKVLDKDREKLITDTNTITVAFGVDDTYLSALPKFKVKEIERDENTNELTITGYDALYSAANFTVTELELEYPLTISDIAIKCATLIGLDDIDIRGGNFSDIYETINLEGTETIRNLLDAIAEITQTIYFIEENTLVFRQLTLDNAPDYIIDKSQYFSLKTEDSRTLANICHSTELGDNITTTSGLDGEIQYIRNNPFWELREDVADLVEGALAAVGGLTISPFTCEWRGNFLLTLGDKLAFQTKDENLIYSYLLNDSMVYQGGLKQKSDWSYNANEAETAANPTTLGEVIKQTYAKVDKANKSIELVASEVSENSNKISLLEMNTDSISASVEKMETNTNNAIGSINDEIVNLTSRVDATVTAEQLEVEISSVVENGVEKVVTATGFTFDSNGMTVSKSGSEMTTTITEDGMKVYRDNTAVLTANNVGVDAVNLHATTYLIIGNNSRFEDYGSNRTGCFWIGGGLNG